ncbi:UNVERIFIED_CONTAM: hypothetical protein Slati_3057100 [Sesamum latifolium]|uniref:Uncharacterized protein n=1 Tax=Sesamum latifolium TaxID=2727402 RepID=A0AAW2UTQ9_9LAMI
MEVLQIVEALLQIHRGPDTVCLHAQAEYTPSSLLSMHFCPCTAGIVAPLLDGPMTIPRNSFILWLAVQGKLSTMDKPWLNIEASVFSVQQESWRHMTAFSLGAASQLNVWRSVGGKLGSNGLSSTGIRESIWHLGDGDVSILSTQHIDTYSLAFWVPYLARENNTRLVIGGTLKQPMVIAAVATEQIKCRIMSHKVNNIALYSLYRLWRIPWLED